MVNSERSDQNLIEAYLSGDAHSFEILYERYRRPLYAYLNKMVPAQPHTADDLFQKTWIKAIKNLDRYQDQQTFFAWIVRIAHNASIDHFRQESKRQTSDISDFQVMDDSEPPWQQMSRVELTEAVNKALDELPAEQREVFLLRRKDVPFKEIAALQGCSVNTVLGRMHYAMNKLRQQVREHAD